LHKVTTQFEYRVALSVKGSRNMSQQNAWRNYEEVAQYLLDQLASHFGLGRVEGKVDVPGAGTSWEIDLKGVPEDGQGFVIIECRRHTKQGVRQKDIAALGFTILRTGAVGGIIVSPRPLQSGANKAAKSESILEVKLDENSTKTDYILTFLNKLFVGRCDNTTIGDNLEGEIIRYHDQN